MLKVGCQKSVNFDYKNEDFSESLNSFHSKPIFPPRSGHKLSRNLVVVSIAFSEGISNVRKGPRHDPRNHDFHEISTFS